MTPGSVVKMRITHWGNSTATSVVNSPTPRANFTPMETTLRMLSLSFLPQYWAAKIKIAPSMPPTNICTTDWSWPPTYTPEMASSPRDPIITLSAKFTAKVTRFCREMGTASRISDR